jgi:hypothetical protein
MSLKVTVFCQFQGFFLFADNKVNYSVRIWNTKSEAKDEDIESGLDEEED